MNTFTLLGRVVVLLFLSLPMYASDQDTPVSESGIQTLIQKAKEHTFKDLRKALYFTNLAETKAKNSGQPDKLFRINQVRGWCFENNNQPDSAAHFYGKALDYAVDFENEKEQLEAFSDLAVIARRQTNYSESKNYRLKALEIAENLNDAQALAVTYHGLGTLYKEVGDYDQSATYFLKAVEFNEQNGDIGRAVNTMQFLASTYAEAGHSNIALETIQKASEQAFELKDTILIGLVSFDFGKILGMLNRNESASEKFRSSLEIFESIQHKPLIARTLLYMADNYSQQKEYDSAHEYFQKCFELESYISMKGQADLNYKLGDLYFNQKDFKAAKQLFEKSLLIAETQKFKDFCQKNNYRLYQLYSEENQPEKAMAHLENYVKFKDALVDEEKAKKITELQFKYEVAKNEQEFQKLKIQQNEWVQKSGVVLFSMILFFLIYAIWTSKKNNDRLKTKNEEIQKKNVKLKESNEVLKQFAYVTGHDLKEPLRNIGSFVNLMDRRYGDQLPGESKEYMQYVLKGVRRMDGLLNSLLEYSTISGQKASEKMINTQDVVHDVIFSMRDTIARKKAVIECAAGMPPMRMNSLHLTQLFQNLIGNSLKFSEQNPVVKISGKTTEKELLFSVRDNGIGIHEDHGNKIFKLFYKPDKSSVANGTGIGLTICKNIIDKYNGRIWFEENDGEGTAFYFAFPKELAA